MWTFGAQDSCVQVASGLQSGGHSLGHTGSGLQGGGSQHSHTSASSARALAAELWRHVIKKAQAKARC